MSLQNTQKLIFDFLKGNKGFGDELSFIQSSKGIPNCERLQSYKDSFEARIHETMENDFEVFAILLDNECLIRALLNDYFLKYPPDTHFINEIGKDFHKFFSDILFNNNNSDELNYSDSYDINEIKKAKDRLIEIKTSSSIEKSNVFLELIKLEYLMTESFYDYYTKLKPKKTYTLGDQTLTWNDSLKLFTSPFPLDKIWNDEAFFETQQSFLAVWTNSERRMFCKSFTELEFEILSKLCKYPSIEEAIDNINSKWETSEIVNCTQNLFSKMLENQILL